MCINEGSIQIGEGRRELRISGFGTSLVVQWLEICLEMQRTWVQSLVRELRPHMPLSN